MAGLEQLKSLFSDIESFDKSDVTSLDSDFDNITLIETKHISSMKPEKMIDIFGDIGGIFNNEITAKSLSNIGSFKYSENFREINLPTLDHIVNFGNVAYDGNPNISGIGYSDLQPKLDVFREVSGEGLFFEGISPTRYFEAGTIEQVIGIKGSTRKGDHSPNIKDSTWFYGGISPTILNFNEFNIVDGDNQRRTGFANGDFINSQRIGFNDLKTPYTIEKFDWIDKRLITQEATSTPPSYRKGFKIPAHVRDVIGFPPIQEELDGRGVFDAQSMFWPFTGVDAGTVGMTTEEFFINVNTGDVFGLSDELGEWNQFKAETNIYMGGAVRWLSLLGYNAPGNSIGGILNPLFESVFGTSLSEIENILTNPASLIESLFESKSIKYQDSVFELTEGMVKNKSAGMPTDADAPVLKKTGEMFRSFKGKGGGGIPIFDNPHRGIAFQVLGDKNNPDGLEELPSYEDIISSIEFGRSSGIDPNNIDSYFDKGITNIIDAINSVDDFNPFPPGYIIPAKSTSQPKLDYSYQFMVENTIGLQLPFNIESFGSISFSMPDGATGPWKEFGSLIWPFEHFTPPTLPNINLHLGSLPKVYNSVFDIIKDNIPDFGGLVEGLFDSDEIIAIGKGKLPSIPEPSWLNSIKDIDIDWGNIVDFLIIGNREDYSPEFKNFRKAINDFGRNNILSKYLLIPMWTGLTKFGQLSLTFDYGEFLRDSTSFISESDVIKKATDALGGAWKDFTGTAHDYVKDMSFSLPKIDFGFPDFGFETPEFLKTAGDKISKFKLPSVSFKGGSLGKIDFTSLAKDLSGALSLVGELGLNLNPISEFQFPSIDLQNPIKKTDYGGQAKFSDAWGPPTGRNEPRHLTNTYPVKSPTLGDMIRTDVSTLQPTWITNAETTPYSELDNPETHKAPNLKKNIRGLFYPSKLQALSSDGRSSGVGDSQTVAPLERDYKNFTKGGKHPIEDPSYGMPFYFKDMRDGTYIVFRGYVEGLTENISPTWTSENYIGRSEPVYIYERGERDISFTLKLFAQTKVELLAIYSKLRRLSSLCYPEYHPDFDLQKLRMKPPITKFRMGELYGNIFNQGITGFVKSLSYSIPDVSPWETDMFQRVPKHITAAVSYQIIHDSPPDKLTKFYGIGSPMQTADLRRG